jgi:hypothetical protein
MKKDFQMKARTAIYVLFAATVLFAVSCGGKQQPKATVNSASINDSLVYNGQTIIADGISLVDITLTVSHPRFEKLNEDFGLEPFANIVRRTAYIAIQRDNRTVFVVGGYDANTNEDMMLNVYDHALLFKKDKQYTLANVRYVFVIPKEYENDGICLKIFNQGAFGFLESKTADSTVRTYEEPDDVWFEYKIK